MLQTVLGLDAVRIAQAFLVKPAAMGQRLTRAKTKIRDAGIPYEVPDAKELPARLDAVLEAIYAAYGSGWDDVAGADTRSQGFTKEAIDLGRLLNRLMIAEPEAQGLLALMLHTEARRPARRTAAGDYVPLSEQDVSLWTMPMISEAEHLLMHASQLGRIGRFQLEAAIQSAHARRRLTGKADWEGVALLYEGLVRIAPTIGALVGRAAAIAEARDPVTAWHLLKDVPPDAVKSYQPYWALAAHLLASAGQHEAATGAYERAIGLCMDPAMQAFLMHRARHLAEIR
jgi:RNA polymerase sigma-70 factor (ECF subfamily)